jgi:hypothetical protein
VSASVVLVSSSPVSATTRARWTTGLASLESWFGREWARYRPASPVPMIRVQLDGVVEVETLPLAPGKAQTLGDRARESIAFQAQIDEIEGRLGAHPKRDATIYVVLRPTGHERMVEGVAEAGGRLGMVEGVLDDDDLTLELTALAHELLHCLGAKDKYDADGHTVLPDGLANPDLRPLFPQAAAEVMVGEIPTGREAGKPIDRIENVQIGPTTAREIRWAR